MPACRSGISARRHGIPMKLIIFSWTYARGHFIAVLVCLQLLKQLKCQRSIMEFGSYANQHTATDYQLLGN